MNHQRGRYRSVCAWALPFSFSPLPSLTLPCLTRCSPATAYALQPCFNTRAAAPPHHTRCSPATTHALQPRNNTHATAPSQHSRCSPDTTHLSQPHHNTARFTLPPASRHCLVTPFPVSHHPPFSQHRPTTNTACLTSPPASHHRPIMVSSIMPDNALKIKS